jgi:hypothetical protein
VNDPFMFLTLMFLESPCNFQRNYENVKLYKRFGLFNLDQLIKEKKILYNCTLPFKKVGDYYVG